MAHPAGDQETRTRPRAGWTGEQPGPRLLIESPDGAVQWAARELLEDHGFSVQCCDGPSADHECELVTHGRCSLVDDADLVLNFLDPHRPATLDIVARMRKAHPETPVVVEASKALTGDGDATDTNVVVMRPPLAGPKVLDAVRAAADLPAAEGGGR